jgi:hypothetical protein
LRSDAERQSARELRHFGFGTAAGLTILALAAHTGRGPLAWLGAPEPAASIVIAGLAGAIATAALFAPHWNRPLQRCLHALAHAVAFVTLLLFFYGVLTPFGVAARLAGHDPLWIRPASGRDSYWRRHRPRDKASYFNQS